MSTPNTLIKRVHLFCCFLIALLLYPLSRYFFKAFYYIPYPYQLDYGEGTVLSLVNLMQVQGTYFTSLHQYPFIHAIYPPIYILLSIPFAKIFGSALMGMRILTLLSAIAVSAVIYAILYKQTSRKIYSCMFAMLFLAPWPLQFWGLIGRVDITACLFSLLGLYFFQNDIRVFKKVRLLSPIFFVAAFYTKQSHILAAASVFFAMILQGYPKREYLRIFFTYLTMFFLFLAIGCFLTQGQFYAHLFYYTAIGYFDFGNLKTYLMVFIVLFSPIIIWTQYSSTLFVKRIHQSKYFVYFIYFILTAISLIGLGRTGANQNYFIEPYIAIILIVALLGHHVLEQVEKEGKPRLGLYVFFLCLALQVIMLISTYWKEDRQYGMPTDVYHLKHSEARTEIDRLVKTTVGDILSDDVSILVKNKREPMLDAYPFITFSKRGKWSPLKVIKDCQKGSFSLIISDGRVSEIPGMGECLEKVYHQPTRIDRYDVYRKI